MKPNHRKFATSSFIFTRDYLTPDTKSFAMLSCSLPNLQDVFYIKSVVRETALGMQDKTTLPQTYLMSRKTNKFNGKQNTSMEPSLSCILETICQKRK